MDSSLASPWKFYQQNSNLGKHLPVIPEAEPRWGSPRQLHGLLRCDVTASVSQSHNDLDLTLPVILNITTSNNNKNTTANNIFFFK